MYIWENVEVHNKSLQGLYINNGNQEFLDSLFLKEVQLVKNSGAYMNPLKMKIKVKWAWPYEN